MIWVADTQVRGDEVVPEIVNGAHLLKHVVGDPDKIQLTVDLIGFNDFIHCCPITMHFMVFKKSF